MKAGTTSLDSHCSPTMVSSPRSGEGFEKESKEGKQGKESVCSRAPVSGTAGTELNLFIRDLLLLGLGILNF